jgi:hypothetical protein
MRSASVPCPCALASLACWPLPLRLAVTRVPDRRSYWMAEPTVENFFEAFLPSKLTATMHTTAINATSKAYSTSDAPSSDRPKRARTPTTKLCQSTNHVSAHSAISQMGQGTRSGGGADRFPEVRRPGAGSSALGAASVVAAADATGRLPARLGAAVGARQLRARRGSRPCGVGAATTGPVRAGRLELPPPRRLGPKPSASANSATPA